MGRKGTYSTTDYHLPICDTCGWRGEWRKSLSVAEADCDKHGEIMEGICDEPTTRIYSSAFVDSPLARR